MLWSRILRRLGDQSFFLCLPVCLSESIVSSHSPLQCCVLVVEGLGCGGGVVEDGGEERDCGGAGIN